MYIYIYIVLSVGKSKALPVLYPHTAQFMWGANNTARHTVIVLAFLTQENKGGKMQSTINQLKHGKRRAVCNNGTRGVVSIDQYSTWLHWTI